jgi:hypothetical protein
MMMHPAGLSLKFTVVVTYIPILLEVAAAPDYSPHVLDQLICLHLLVELGQVLGECLLELLYPQDDCEQDHQCRGALHMAVVE